MALKPLLLVLSVAAAFAVGRTFADSGPPKLSDKAKAIVDQFKPNLATLAVYVTYVPKAQEQRPSIELYGPSIVLHPGDSRFHTTGKQSQKLFDWLIADGYFDRATEVLAEKSRDKLPKGPFYDLTVSVGSPWPMYHASIGWNKMTITRLRAIQERLDGEAAKAIAPMIKAIFDDLSKDARYELPNPPTIER